MGERKVTQGLLSRIAIGVFGLMTIAMILLAVFDERGALAVRERRHELEGLKIEIQEAIEKNEKTADEIEELRHNPKAIERKAREELKLVKPGEVMIEIPDEAPARKDQPAEKDPSKAQE